MNMTAVTDLVNKKQTNSSIKRARSPLTFDDRWKSKRRTNLRDYFSHERPFADVKIQFNHQIIWCDKALLAAASPILCEELLKMNSKDDVLVLEDIDLEEFFLLLEFIYPIFNPEINKHTISCLIKLSYRFQFGLTNPISFPNLTIVLLDVLQHACQFYIMQYLNTIRHVSGKCQTSEIEEDCFVNNPSNDHQSAYENYKKHDLIEFHDGTCINAYHIIRDLCQWLETYFYEENRIVLQSIIAILQQVSVNTLNLVLHSIDINDDIKAYIYKERARYLEEMHQIKHLV